MLTLNFPLDEFPSVSLALSMNMGGPEGDGSPQASAQSHVVPRSVLITTFESSEMLDVQKILLKYFKVRNYRSWKALVVKETVEYDLFL